MKIVAKKAAKSILGCSYSLERFMFRHRALYHGRGIPVRVAKWMVKPSPIWLQLEPGIKMLLDPSDLISEVLLETGEWEPGAQVAIKRHLAPGGTFVDVGAHIGYCSLKAASLVGPHGRVVAIEANPEMVSKLRGNIEASGAKVTVEAVACFDSETVIDIFRAYSTNSGRSSISSANASLGGMVGALFSVQARSLDAILQETRVSRVDVVKIDVEGAELNVLKGARGTLMKWHPVLVVELDDELLKQVGTSSTEVMTFLELYGYSCHGPFDKANYTFVRDNN